MTKKLTIFSLFIFFSSSVFAETLPIHRFHNLGDTTGYLYAEFTKDNLLKSAQIKIKDNILYTINKKGFSNSEKLQMACACDPFYGFTINELTATRISVTMTNSQGREVSDTATINWDKENEKFTFLFTP